MLINASKREEEGVMGYAAGGGLLGTRNEFIKGKERRTFPPGSLREEVRFYGNSSSLSASLTLVILCG